jgi:Uma2 family endonuclease
LGEAAERLWTVEAFLARGERPGVREELVDGRIVAMAPPRDQHGTIVANASYEIRRRLRRPCRVVADTGVRIDETSLFVPDLVVSCSPRDADGRTVDPVSAARLTPTASCPPAARSGSSTASSVGSGSGGGSPRVGA